MARIVGTTIGREPEKKRLRVGRGVPGGGRALPHLPSGATLRPTTRAQPRVTEPASSRGPTPRIVPSPFISGPTLPRGIASAEPVQVPRAYRASSILGRPAREIIAQTDVGMGRQPRLTAGQKRLIDVMEDPDTRFNPKDRRTLRALVNPGPVVEAAIAGDPKIQKNRLQLLEHIGAKGPGVKLPAQDLIVKMRKQVGSGKMPFTTFVEKNKAALGKLSDEEQQRFSDAYDETLANKIERPIAPTEYEVQSAAAMNAPTDVSTQFISNLFSDAYESAAGFFPGAVQAVQHPVRTAEDIAGAYAHQYGPLVHGDVKEFGRRFYEHPLGPILDVAAVASAGLGAAGRAGAAVGAANRMRTLGTPVKTQFTRPNGVTVEAVDVGPYRITPVRGGKFDVRQGGKMVASNFPTEKAAVHHAQSLATGGLSGSRAKNFLHAAVNPTAFGGRRGGLLDLWDDHRGNEHIEEINGIMEDLDELYEAGGKPARRSFLKLLKDTRGDVKVAYKKSKDKGGVMGAGEQALTNVLDLVRIGAIYTRPAYIANNWAGNSFMNLVHQGAFAPVNLGKSFLAESKLGRNNLHALDVAMGKTSAVAGLQPTGILSAATQPGVRALGHIADVPFRRAAFLHEARRSGHRKLSDLNSLFTRASKGDKAAQKEIATIGRRAQEEIVKFGRMNETERSVIKNLLFVYSWVKGAGRYGYRFPLQHPVQSALGIQIGQQGQEWVKGEIGGLPWFMLGSIPVGRKANGDPIMINPFALNPLSTALASGRAIAGTAKLLSGDTSFNKFAEEDVTGLLNPAFQAFLEARGGGPPFPETLAETLAPYRLYQDIRHPGRGSVYPMTREEAITHYVGGGLAPRRASKEAIQESLLREKTGDPVAIFDVQLEDFEKKLGQKLDPEFASQIRADIAMEKEMKDFQKDKAGIIKRSYRRLPPKNQVDVALEFLTKHNYMGYEEASQIKEEIKGLDDRTLHELVLDLWNSTGIGSLKREWQTMRREAVPPKRTPRVG